MAAVQGEPEKGNPRSTFSPAFVEENQMRKATFSLISLLAVLPLPSLRLEAQTFTVLYTFTGGVDGAFPQAGLVRVKAGNLYGTTVQGGSSPNCFLGCGVVFKLNASGSETVLHSFTDSPDGAGPASVLLRDKAGNLYGTTNSGGSAFGPGTVFKVEASGGETVLYSFAGPPDGANPVHTGLVRDKTGNLYGTTGNGGFLDNGTVFKVDSSGNETVLHRFTDSGTDGSHPVAGLVMDKAGNLYGTTRDGGSIGAGTVFKVDASGNETVLHSFTGLDGSSPFAALVRDRAGNLYGTTFQGGAFGAGTVFKVDASGNETVLHSFTGSADGSTPFAPLVRDKEGNLYGTTASGGSFRNGTVFKVDASGNETVLHSFTGLDGSSPLGGLARDKADNLYGTTISGDSSRFGTVFKLTP